MQTTNKIAVFVFCCLALFPAIMTSAQTSESFYDAVLNAPAIAPADLTSRHIVCQGNAIAKGTSFNTHHLSSEQINYGQRLWEKRISHNWRGLSVPAETGKVLIIDAIIDQGTPHYYYLSNGTEQQVYEPWSSSKIMAFTGAMAKLNTLTGISDPIKIGDSYLADWITSIHSYEPFGTSPGDSDAIATALVNFAGRGYLTQLFFEDWLRLSHDHVFFRGAYGPNALATTNDIVTGIYASSLASPLMDSARQDPDYLDYRCDNCGLTGNKPMTTLAEAEWLKRLAMHELDPQTAHPHLNKHHIDMLFYGTHNSVSNDAIAGMMSGISTMLQHAIARYFGAENTDQTKQVLDEITNGQWRVFQKVGWDPSETRSTTENVVLAQVCLPLKDSGINFTIAAQASVEGDSVENLNLVGQKMQNILNIAIEDYLNQKLISSF